MSNMACCAGVSERLRSDGLATRYITLLVCALRLRPSCDEDPDPREGIADCAPHECAAGSGGSATCAGARLPRSSDLACTGARRAWVGGLHDMRSVLCDVSTEMLPLLHAGRSIEYLCTTHIHIHTHTDKFHHAPLHPRIPIVRENTEVQTHRASSPHATWYMQQQTRLTFQGTLVGRTRQNRR